MSGNKAKTEKKDKTNDVDDHISKRYEMKKRLGKGAYGIVWKAVDKKSKEIVAVKKIFDAFRNQTDAQRTFREIMFLQAFRDHPNVIRLRGLHKASNNKDIYLVFDYMDTDLHHVIKKGNILKDVHRRYIMYQLLRATRYLHSGDVIHRDQKPSNILINAECKIKLADFGLARSVANYYAQEQEQQDNEGPPLLTDYVATRWYRAPEILVASKRYTKGVDMWSLGCILGEMLLGKPLFPGSSTVNQIERIMAALPAPTAREIDNMCSGYGRGLLEGVAGPKTTLREIIKTASEDAMDLVTQLLVFDPTKRLTASQALAHPYVYKFCNGSEICLDHSIVPPLDDDVQLSVAEYRDKLYELISNGKHASKRTSSPKIIKGGSPSLRKKMVESNKAEPDQPAAAASGKRHEEAEGIKENVLYQHKYLTSKVKFYKNHSVEELSKGTVNPVAASKSEPGQKNGDLCNKKTGSSSPPPPRHRNHVPPALTKGADRGMGTRSKPFYGTTDQNKQASWPCRQKLEKQSRSADCGGDGCHLIKSLQQNTCVGSTGYSASRFSPRQGKISAPDNGEKSRQATCGSSSSSNKEGRLPKVSQQRKERFRQNYSSPPSVTNFNQSHGILTSSALHDIRAALKH